MNSSDPRTAPDHSTIRHQSKDMTDILYTLATLGFFALMIAFIAACEKV